MSIVKTICWTGLETPKLSVSTFGSEPSLSIDGNFGDHWSIGIVLNQMNLIFEIWQFPDSSSTLFTAEINSFFQNQVKSLCISPWLPNSKPTFWILATRTTDVRSLERWKYPLKKTVYKWSTGKIYT